VKEASQAYGFAYLTWDKPVSRDEIDKMVRESFHDLSPSEKARLDAFLPKFKEMMLKAFDLGRYDANRNPCPF
jgi:hypothetical protein